MKTVGINAVKDALVELVEASAQGKQPRLSPAEEGATKHQNPVARSRGCMRGKIWISSDFNSALPEELQAAFEGH